MITLTPIGKCHTCHAQRTFNLELGYVSNHGVVPCYICTGCGIVIPAFAWLRYQQEGRIVIPV